MRVIEKVFLWLGLLLLATALFWGVFLQNVFLRAPNGINHTTKYSGSMVWYLDPDTMLPTQPPTEHAAGLTVTHTLQAKESLSTAFTTVLQEKIIFIVQGQEQPVTYSSGYTVSRSNRKNTVGTEAYAIDRSNTIDRTPNYYPFLPLGVELSQEYPLWQDALGEAKLQAASGESKYKNTTLYTFDLGGEELYVLPAKYFSLWGLPESIPFATLQQVLLTTSGINLDEALAIILPALPPEDQALVAQARTQNTPTTYFMLPKRFELVFEPRSGMFISRGNVEENIYLQLDYSVLSGLMSVLNKYVSDLRVGSYIQDLNNKAQALGTAPLTPVLSYTYSPDPATANLPVQTAQDWNDKTTFLVKTLPTALGIAGILLLFLTLSSWYFRLKQQGQPRK